MPRQPRLVIPDVAIHIVQRGNNRAVCFADERDCLLYLLHLRDLTAKLGCALHAYCLMTNHVHLLMTPRSDLACADLMRDLGQRYVQYFNRRHCRTGTLWEGRFRSCIADSSAYVLACYRYIELNPVRAGMVLRPSDFPWSSHAANTGERADQAITPHAEYLALGNEPAMQQSAYRALFASELATPLVQEIRNATNGGYPLGSEAFKSTVKAATGRRVDKGRPGRPRADGASNAGKSGPDPDLISGGAAS